MLPPARQTLPYHLPLAQCSVAAGLTASVSQLVKTDPARLIKQLTAHNLCGGADETRSVDRSEAS